MTRRQWDWYQTPGWATETLIAHVNMGGRVFEPCAGDGAIVTPVRASGRTVITNDLDRRWETDLHGDATDPAFWQSLPEPFDWVVSNPPFSDAHLILPLAHQHAKAVAMLLRLSYLEPCEGRAAWLEDNPPDQLIVLPRISFTGDGNTDSVTCAWMVWAPVVWGNAIVVVRPIDPRQGSLLERTDDATPLVGSLLDLA